MPRALSCGSSTSKAASPSSTCSTSSIHSAAVSLSPVNSRSSNLSSLSSSSSSFKSPIRIDLTRPHPASRHYRPTAAVPAHLLCSPLVPPASQTLPPIMKVTFKVRHHPRLPPFARLAHLAFTLPSLAIWPQIPHNLNPSLLTCSLLRSLGSQAAEVHARRRTFPAGTPTHPAPCSRAVSPHQPCELPRLTTDIPCNRSQLSKSRFPLRKAGTPSCRSSSTLVIPHSPRSSFALVQSTNLVIRQDPEG